MGTVINRSTMEVLTSRETADFDPNDYILIEKGRDNTDYESILLVPTKYWKVVDDRLAEMTQPEKEAVDSALLAEEFLRLRNRLIVLVERNISSRLATGCEFPPASGKFFSLTPTSQTTIIGLLLGKDVLTSMNAYPVKFNTADQMAFHAFADANEVLQFFVLALGTVKGIQDDATSYKELARAAVTIGDLEAVADLANLELD